MKSTRFGVRIVVCLAGVAVSAASLHAARKPRKIKVLPAEASPVKPGELKVDLPSLRCLAFRWFIEGDKNENAAAAVQYRKAGSTEWKQALPLARCHFFTKGYDGRTRRLVKSVASKLPGGLNLLAGSIFGLKPGTQYEVKITLSDPDGGTAERTVKATTRTLPTVWADGREIRIKPGLGAKALRAKLGGLKPGDRIVLEPGTHGRVSLTARGTAEKPIVIEGTDRQKCIVDAPSGEAIMLNKSEHVWVRNLTIKSTKHCVRNVGDFITVTGCKMFGRRRGVYMRGNGLIIADNEIRGPCTWPRSKGIESPHGIDTVGFGHVIAHNRVSGYADGISVWNYGYSDNIEIYGNDLSECTDDAIEADFIFQNARIYGNRFTNCFKAVSLAPILGGPAYFIRNEMYNTSPLKIQRRPSGLYIYHNSSLAYHQGVASPSAERWRCVYLRNNLFLGRNRYAIEATPGYFRVDFDYCGWRKIKGDPESRFFKWNQDRYTTLEAFKKAGFQAHSIQVETDLWKRAADPDSKKQYVIGSPETPDFTLREGSAAVDAGCILPNVNDGFAGEAPDLGSREVGAPAPVYGPRK